MTQPTLINLHPNEYSQELRYYHLHLIYNPAQNIWNKME